MREVCPSFGVDAMDATSFLKSKKIRSVQPVQKGQALVRVPLLVVESDGIEVQVLVHTSSVRFAAHEAGADMIFV
jgi:hypothetical protein